MIRSSAGATKAPRDQRSEDVFSGFSRAGQKLIGSGVSRPTVSVCACSGKMSEPDIIFRRLDLAASRIRFNERLEDGTWLAICLLIVAIAYQLLRATIAGTAVFSALVPLLLITAALLFAWFGWRLVGRDIFLPVDRAGAAAIMDARAGLDNELSSALWFSASGSSDAFVRLHLERAARAAGKLECARLVPLVIPRNLSIAVVLFIVSTLILLMPPLAEDTPGELQVANRLAQLDAAQLSVPGADDDTDTSEDAFSDQLADTAWLKVEALARDLRASPYSADVAQAIAARDAKKASRLLASMRQRETAQPATGAAARPETEQMSEQLAKGIVDRLQSLLNEGGGWSEQAAPDDAGGSNERLTDDLTRELREEMQNAQESLPGEMSAEEQVLNTTLQGMSRDSTGGQEIVRGETNPMQGLGRTSVGSGAMGRRVGVSTGGAGDGEQPTGNPEGDAEAQPVLGRKTMRLQLQMQTVKIDQPETELADGNEETFYAATQAQAANTQYESVVASQRGGAEQSTSDARLPIVYRDAVRTYSVRQHRRELLTDQ